MQGFRNEIKTIESRSVACFSAFVRKRIDFLIILISFLLIGNVLKAQDFFLKEDSLMAMLKTRYNSPSENRILIATEIMSRHIPDEPICDSLKNLLIREAEEGRNRDLDVFYL